jgi:hypothetical protein
VEGISADEAWWYVLDPENPQNFFWVPRDQTTFTGNIATVKLVSPTPAPAAARPADAPYVQITSITLDTQNDYVVNYVARNFTPALPGTHMHFFFNTTPADQVGTTGGGNRLMYAGPPPFLGYTVADRPSGAASICVLVANPDHTVQPGSGNCFPLP